MIFLCSLAFVDGTLVICNYVSFISLVDFAIQLANSKENLYKQVMDEKRFCGWISTVTCVQCNHGK